MRKEDIPLSILLAVLSGGIFYLGLRYPDSRYFKWMECCMTRDQKIRWNRLMGAFGLFVSIVGLLISIVELLTNY